MIVERADHNKEHMGLTTWRNAPEGKIIKADVSIAKNYLSVDEMQELNEIVTIVSRLCDQTGKAAYSDDNGGLDF